MIKIGLDWTWMVWTMWNITVWRWAVQWVRLGWLRRLLRRRWWRLQYRLPPVGIWYADRPFRNHQSCSRFEDCHIPAFPAVVLGPDSRWWGDITVSFHSSTSVCPYHGKLFRSVSEGRWGNAKYHGISVDDEGDDYSDFDYNDYYNDGKVNVSSVMSDVADDVLDTFRERMKIKSFRVYIGFRF